MSERTYARIPPSPCCDFRMTRHAADGIIGSDNVGHFPCCGNVRTLLPNREPACALAEQRNVGAPSCSAVAVSKLAKPRDPPSFISRTSDRSAPPADLADPLPSARPLPPRAANHVWAYDFVFDSCANGQQLKCLPSPQLRLGIGGRFAPTTLTSEPYRWDRRNAGRRPTSIRPPRRRLICVRRQAHRRLSGAGEGWYKNDPPSLVLAHRQRAIPLHVVRHPAFEECLRDRGQRRRQLAGPECHTLPYHT